MSSTELSKPLCRPPRMPFFDDSQLYYYTAKNLAEGKGYRYSTTEVPRELPEYFRPAPLSDTYYQNFYPPVYSSFLGICYYFFGASILAYAIPQIILGTVSCYLTFVIAKEIFPSKAALMAGFLLSVYHPLVWWTSYIRSETLFIFLLLFAILFLLKAVKNNLDIKNTVLAGVILAVTCLCRTAVLYLPIFIVFYFIIIFFRKDKKRLLYGIPAFLLSFYLSLSPWAYRNYTLYNKFTITSSDAWATFYGCNVTSADLPFFDLYEIKYDEEKAAMALSKGLKEESIEFVKKYPVKYITLCIKRFIALAASSHTGSLAGSGMAWEALRKQTGAILARDLEEFMDILAAFYYLPGKVGRRLAILSGPGGPAVSAADACEEFGLQVADLREETRRRLKAVIPQTGTSANNPVDLGLASIFQVDLYGRAAEIVGEDPGVDGLLLQGRGATAELDEQYSHWVIETQKKVRKPFMAVSLGGMYLEEKSKKALLEAVWNPRLSIGGTRPVGLFPPLPIRREKGGRNFGGLTFPFLQDKLTGSRPNLRAIAVEPASCPRLTKGAREYDFGDTAGTTPLMMMHTLGHNFVPPPVHSGGLRYHGSAPFVSHLLAAGAIEAEAYEQKEVFESAVTFARCEGTIPAPESAHAVHATIRHALAARESGEKKVILFNLSGHGIFDMAAYEAFLGGTMA